MAKFISDADPLNILLVEDSNGDAILIENSLAQALPNAYHSIRVKTITSALKEISEKEFDVVLLDHTLPDVIEFSGLLSIQNMAPQLPIIFLTAFKDDVRALNAIEYGAQDYLFKDQVDGNVIKHSIQYAIHRKLFESILITRANFDPLTGLANRALFENRLDIALAHMKRTPNGIGIFIMDLDRFKRVNDTLGHSAGDKLLKKVAERLKKCLRPYDTVARFGGDEFALLIEGVFNPEHFESIVNKIIRLIEEPFNISGNYPDIGISSGIVRCTDGECTRDDLIVQADKALYKAKASEHGKYAFCNASNDEQIIKF